MYYLCEKYYKSITVQYYTDNCVSWVPRLTLADLGKNWTFKHTLGMKLIYRGLTVLQINCIRVSSLVAQCLN